MRDAGGPIAGISAGIRTTGEIKITSESKTTGGMAAIDGMVGVTMWCLRRTMEGGDHPPGGRGTAGAHQGTADGKAARVHAHQHVGAAAANVGHLPPRRRHPRLRPVVAARHQAAARPAAAHLAASRLCIYCVAIVSCGIIKICYPNVDPLTTPLSGWCCNITNHPFGSPCLLVFPPSLIRFPYTTKSQQAFHTTHSPHHVLQHNDGQQMLITGTLPSECISGAQVSSCGCAVDLCNSTNRGRPDGAQREQQSTRF